MKYLNDVVAFYEELLKDVEKEKLVRAVVIEMINDITIENVSFKNLRKDLFKE